MIEMEPDGAGWPVALFSNYDFGIVARLGDLLAPGRVFLDVLDGRLALNTAFMGDGVAIRLAESSMIRICLFSSCNDKALLSTSSGEPSSTRTISKSWVIPVAAWMQRWTNASI